MDFEEDDEEQAGIEPVSDGRTVSFLYSILENTIIYIFKKRSHSNLLF